MPTQYISRSFPGGVNGRSDHGCTDLKSSKVVSEMNLKLLSGCKVSNDELEGFAYYERGGCLKATWFPSTSREIDHCRRSTYRTALRKVGRISSDTAMETACDTDCVLGSSHSPFGPIFSLQKINTIRTRFEAKALLKMNAIVDSTCRGYFLGFLRQDCSSPHLGITTLTSFQLQVSEQRTKMAHRSIQACGHNSSLHVNTSTLHFGVSSIDGLTARLSGHGLLRSTYLSLSFFTEECYASQLDSLQCSLSMMWYAGQRSSSRGKCPLSYLRIPVRLMHEE
jgi:hypothetical protein